MSLPMFFTPTNKFGFFSSFNLIFTIANKHEPKQYFF
jgi:hypothetical protein